MHELPNDIHCLKTLIVEQKGVMLEQQEMIIALKRALSDKAAEIQYLKSQLSELRRLHFGCRSEKIGRQIVRLEKRLSELEEEYIEELAPNDPEVPAALRQSPARKPFPAELPREIKE